VASAAFLAFVAPRSEGHPRDTLSRPSSKEP
jgi:hypothetical protein